MGDTYKSLHFCLKKKLTPEWYFGKGERNTGRRGLYMYAYYNRETWQL